MTALHDFITAAASYFGLPVEQLTQGSTLDTSNGDIEVVLRIALTCQDVADIAQRMQRIALETKVDEALAGPVGSVVLNEKLLREQYTNLSATAKSSYGSFAKFKAAALEKVSSHVGQPCEVELPKVVWLERGEATEQQKAMAIGVDERGRYGVDPDDLTEDQRFKYMHDGATGG